MTLYLYAQVGLILGIFLGGMGWAVAEAVPPLMPEATAAARSRQAQQQDDLTAIDRYDRQQHPFTAAQETHWRQTLWATAVREPQGERARAAEGAIVDLLTLATAPTAPTPTQERLITQALQVAHQLYTAQPQEFAGLEGALGALVRGGDDRQIPQGEALVRASWVAAALTALVEGGQQGDPRTLLAQVQENFPQEAQLLPLSLALRDLARGENPPPLPPLGDLLQGWLQGELAQPGQAWVYVLCRPDRGVLCRVLVKDDRGQFYLDPQAEDRVWSVLLSGRSLHGLPWYLSRGETPQGLYRMEGTIPQPDQDYFRAYGYFPLVTLFVPGEPGLTSFGPQPPAPIAVDPDDSQPNGGIPGEVPAPGGLARSASPTTLRDYQALLPPRWRNYTPLHQTYWAGKLGRGLFRIHGTGEDPAFFANNQRYPLSSGWNPAIGCLSAQELYDAQGQWIQGGMPGLLEALHQVTGGKMEGYTLVVEVPSGDPLGDQQPVTWEEIIPAIAPVPPSAQATPPPSLGHTPGVGFPNP
jgi:hypothetical protein